MAVHSYAQYTIYVVLLYAVWAPSVSGAGLRRRQGQLTRVPALQDVINNVAQLQQEANHNAPSPTPPATCMCMTCGGVQGPWESGACAAGSSPAGIMCKNNPENAGCYSSLDDHNCHCPGTVGALFEHTRGERDVVEALEAAEVLHVAAPAPATAAAPSPSAAAATAIYSNQVNIQKQLEALSNQVKQLLTTTPCAAKTAAAAAPSAAAASTPAAATPAAAAPPAPAPTATEAATKVTPPPTPKVPCPCTTTAAVEAPAPAPAAPAAPAEKKPAPAEKETKELVPCVTTTTVPPCSTTTLAPAAPTVAPPAPAVAPPAPAVFPPVVPPMPPKPCAETTKPPCATTPKPCATASGLTGMIDAIGDVGKAAEPVVKKSSDPCLPTPPATTSDFFSRVSLLLTCPQLEAEVAEKCGAVPIYAAVAQFQGSEILCNKALEQVPRLGELMAETFGPKSNCETTIAMWRFKADGHEFGSAEECFEEVRTKDFSAICRLV